ncbi:MAG: carboxypeptidase-like regulatory domain-containing protein [bacterium]
MIVWPAVIFGVVKDQEGRGLESAVIDIAYSGQRVAQLISRLPDGDYGLSPSFLGEESSLTISYGHRYTFYETFYVVGPTQCDFIMIPGTVRDEITGIPLGRVEVLATSLDSPYLQATTTTDPDGTYQLFLPVIRTAGDRRDYKDYTITARLPLSSGSNTNHTATPVRVPSEGSKQLNFALNLPQFSGKVVDILNHSPLKGAEIKISPAPSTVILPIANTIESGPEGNFHVPLPLGTYTLEVTKSKYQPKTVTLQFYATMENYLIELTREEDRPRPQNTRPVITSPQDGQEITVNAGKELRFSVVAQDAENPYLFYTIQGGAKDWPQIPPEDPEGGSAGIPKEYHHLTSLADLGEYTLKITVSDLDLVTSVHIKVKVQYPLQLRLTRGLNLISYPAGPEGSIDSAFDLLSLLGDANKVESISRYDTIQGKYISAGYTQDGKKRGSDFPISSQEGYTVYAKQPVTVNLKIQRANLTSCTLNLKQGTNLVGIPVVMGDRYSSHDLLLDLGPNTAGSLYHYNPAKGACEFTYWIGNHPGGEDFPIQMGEGYFIEAITDKQLSLPLLR